MNPRTKKILIFTFLGLIVVVAVVVGALAGAGFIGGSRVSSAIGGSSSGGGGGGSSGGSSGGGPAIAAANAVLSDSVYLGGTESVSDKSVTKTRVCVDFLSNSQKIKAVPTTLKMATAAAKCFGIEKCVMQMNATMTEVITQVEPGPPECVSEGVVFFEGGGPIIFTVNKSKISSDTMAKAASELIMTDKTAVQIMYMSTPINPDNYAISMYPVIVTDTVLVDGKLPIAIEPGAGKDSTTGFPVLLFAAKPDTLKLLSSC